MDHLMKCKEIDYNEQSDEYEIKGNSDFLGKKL